VICPWCGVDGYDNVIFLAGDPENHPRCGNCLNDVRTEFIERFVPRRQALDTIDELSFYIHGLLIGQDRIAGLARAEFLTRRKPFLETT
jgi:hypothetical protein